MRIEVQFIEKASEDNNHGVVIQQWYNSELYPLKGEEINFLDGPTTNSNTYLVTGVRHLGQFVVQCFVKKVSSDG